MLFLLRSERSCNIFFKPKGRKEYAMSYTRMQAYYAKEKNKRECILHSHNDWHWAYFVCKPIEEKNEYIFMTEDGTFCTAIFNPFRMTYYVDDLYGCLKQEQVVEYLPLSHIRGINGYDDEEVR